MMLAAERERECVCVCVCVCEHSMLPMQEIQAPALVRELRSHMLCRAAKRFKKETNKKKN